MYKRQELSPHELKEEMRQWFAFGELHKLALTIHSFSYKRGIPRGVDTLIDCRFLNNPYWEPSLRLENGTSAAVQNFLRKDELFAEFFSKTLDLIKYLLPAYKKEGKSHLSIGFGCTGGQHRSVAVTELMREALAQSAWQVSIRHRDLETKTI